MPNFVSVIVTYSKINSVVIDPKIEITSLSLITELVVIDIVFILNIEVSAPVSYKTSLY